MGSKDEEYFGRHGPCKARGLLQRRRPEASPRTLPDHRHRSVLWGWCSGEWWSNAPCLHEPLLTFFQRPGELCLGKNREIIMRLRGMPEMLQLSKFINGRASDPFLRV